MANDRTDAPSSADLDRLAQRLTSALERLEQAPQFARPSHIGRFLDAAARLLRAPGGAQAAYLVAARLDAAGVFVGTDWQHPERLQLSIVPGTLEYADDPTVTLELLNLLRLLAVFEGNTRVAGYSTEQAERHLKDVLALCLDYVFERATEVARVRGKRQRGIQAVLQFIADRVGREDLLPLLVNEILRLLRQRPIQLQVVREMVTRLAIYCYDPQSKVTMPAGAERLISALFGPSPASREDPGTAVYAERLARMSNQHLQEEATACARSMQDTGLVSQYHAVLLRHVFEHAPELVTATLGLSSTGIDVYLTYRELVHALMDKVVHTETCQCLYGLAAMLERSLLHHPGVAASLWRQLMLPLASAAQARLIGGCSSSVAPDIHLLAGVISVLGQPLGIGQGDNPTCQAARAISMWAYSDPDYLLQLLAWAARDDGILMRFQGHEISSAFLPEGEAGAVGHDLDPVSLVLVPHLDRVYAEMTRLANSGDEDPHRYINPEFHGWQVGRGFAIAVDVTSGQLQDYENFVRLFYACFHPGYNGGHPVIHPQPVGLAVTDSSARFIGWHAITLLRVTLDQSGVTRVYFFNPNNDGGQNLGNGVVVSTDGNGEAYGESSLPIDEFVSRLYLFHYDMLEVWDPALVPDDEVQRAMAQGENSWAAERIPAASEQAAAPSIVQAAAHNSPNQEK